MKIISDHEILTRLEKSGYSIEQDDQQVIIRRRFKISLYFWAYGILFCLYLLVNTPNPVNITVGLTIALIGMLFYYYNTVSYMLIDIKEANLVYRKGLLRISKYTKFSDVENIELKTYDVSGSTSPFKKSNRDYIAEVRLTLTEGFALELFSIEADNPEDLRFMKTVFEALAASTGFTIKIVKAQ